MLIIQIIIILFLLYALYRTIGKFREGKVRWGWFGFWILFWLSAGVVVLLPETTNRLADLVGVTRGVDLVIYFAIIVISYLVFRILIKIESLEQEITKVVREEALRNSKNQV